MPTGYTSHIIDENVNWKEYLLLCSGQFGALIDFRDKPLTLDNYPDKIYPSLYYKNKLQESINNYWKFLRLSNKELNQQYNEYIIEDVKNKINQHEKKFKIRKKLELVFLEILKWEPPTKEHEELKKFAMNQIIQTIEFDCDINDIDELKMPISFEEWYRSKIHELVNDIKYYKENWKREQKVSYDKTKWIQELKKSLGFENENNL